MKGIGRQAEVGRQGCTGSFGSQRLTVGQRIDDSMHARLRRYQFEGEAISKVLGMSHRHIRVLVSPSPRQHMDVRP
jgi:hypothetical protein